MTRIHEVDFEISGDDMQFVTVELDPQEAAVAEAGAMMFMDDNIEMETIFGDGSQQQSGFLGALVGAGKRLLTGESLFMTVFVNTGAGLFGGEGFIMQQLEGDGMAFVHAGGTLAERVLDAGESIRVDTGCIVGFQPSVEYDIKFVGGIKSALFGGEGLFFATLRGPGRVWLQSLPFSRLADRIYAAAPQTGGKTRGEGSILGGIGRILDGDNRF
jgi:uncharacterized protein (AIM24 family)